MQTRNGQKEELEITQKHAYQTDGSLTPIVAIYPQLVVCSVFL
jgi:hypothetical protein